MLRIINKEALIDIRDQIELEKLIFGLKDKGYTPILRQMFLKLSEIVNLQMDEKAIADMIVEGYRPRSYPFRYKYLGDLFFTDNAVYSITPIGKNLMATIIAYNRHDELVQKFCIDIEDSIKSKFDGRRVRGMKFKWRPLPFPKFLKRWPFYEDIILEEFEEIDKEVDMKPPDYSKEEAQAAQYLTDDASRKFMLELVKVGKITEKDALNFVKNKKEIIEKLNDLKLIKQEYLIRCRKTQNTLALIPQKELINSEYKCSHCGRPFTDELIQTVYTLTDLGKSIITGSRWMSIWITELLIGCGVKRDGIKWNIKTSGDELDIIVEDFDARIIFELKDREFGLGDAYPFIYRVSRYGGNIGIIVTMDNVSVDAKKFFEEEMRRWETRADIIYLEGFEKVNEELPKIVKKMVLRQISRIIMPFSLTIGVNLLPVVNHKLKEIKKEAD